jgi:hypothetical protein
MLTSELLPDEMCVCANSEYGLNTDRRLVRLLCPIANLGRTRSQQCSCYTFNFWDLLRTNTYPHQRQQPKIDLPSEFPKLLGGVLSLGIDSINNYIINFPKPYRGL